MQFDLLGIGASHLGNLLTLGHALTFLYQKLLIVCISTQVGFVVLDDDQLAITAQSATATQNVSGLGLGLYLAKEIVDEHQGRILLESHPGKGSKFSVILPKKKHQLTTIARSA